MSASKSQRTSTAQRRSRAMVMRLAGVDYQTIAEQLGYANRSTACKDITRGYEQHVIDDVHGVDLLRQQELARLDRLQAALWTTAVSDGDPKAANLILRIVDRRCRLLGLDSPQRHEVVTLDAIDSEIRRLSREIEDEDAEDPPSA